MTNERQTNSLFIVKPSSKLLTELLTRGIAYAAGSQQALSKLAHTLIRVAETAYTCRDLQTVKEASDLLSALPLPHAKNVALWYQAVLKKREGRFAEAIINLESLIGDSRTAPRLRARALHTLGNITYESLNFEDARSLYREAIRYIRRESPHDTYIFPHSIILHSLSRAEEGDSQQALKELLSIENLIEALRNPLLTATYCNNVASELLELGHVSEATRYSRVACASPYAFAYPEWKETALEIERQTAKRNAVAIAVVPEPQPRKRPPQPSYSLIILQFSLPIRVNHPVVFRQRVTCNNPTVALVVLVARIRAPSF